MFKKYATNTIDSIQEPGIVSHLIDQKYLEDFKKQASELKKIAPKANDFLYFSCVMMTAAEASGLNEDGSVKLTKSGEPVKVGFDTSEGTWKWSSNDPTILPFKNANGDIFPEEELLKAYKKWAYKPLCVDHKSSSVEFVRGFIVDTYYDRDRKRVIALCALDKKNYPQLARQVETGYSNCVSMGTAVGRAICSEKGCHKVAKTEQDFCQHMRYKSGYGEINVDLNPIELSIVVNGADPRAKIKHIIAAVHNMNSYAEEKEKQLNKLAEKVSTYSASIKVDSHDQDGNIDSKTKTIDLTSDSLEEFKKDLEAAMTQLNDLEKSFEITEDNQNLAAPMMESEENSVTPSIGVPSSAKFASFDEGAMKELFVAIADKLATMNNNLNKLTIAFNNSNNKENQMSEKLEKSAYYQGTEEPKPGQKQYPVDPMNEQLRSKDKHMVGQRPFPGVGSIDGMHPSPESVDVSDEAKRKEMLARATKEERAALRTEAMKAIKEKLETNAFFQGTEEPTPGKKQYPVDPMNDKVRKTDKQMVGQKPFPGVGNVDGLHPSPASADVSDELKRKEMLARAGYSAKFTKAANLGDSAWEVSNGDDVVFTATVDELSGGRPAALYETFANKEFGSKLVKQIKSLGADATKSLYKVAQNMVAPPAMDMPPAAPAADAMPAMPEMPAMDMGAPGAAPGEDKGANGDPKAAVMDLVEKAKLIVSDLAEALRGLFGEQAEMGDLAGLGATASEDLVALTDMHKELNSELTSAIKESIADIKASEKELKALANMMDNGVSGSTNKDSFEDVVNSASIDAKEAIASGFKLMSAFVKYARGAEAMKKRASMEASLFAYAHDEDMHSDSEASDLMDLLKDQTVAEESEDHDHEMHEDRMHDELAELDSMMDADDKVEVKTDELKKLMPQGKDVKPGDKVEMTAKAELDLTTKEGRDLARAKIASDLKMDSLLTPHKPKATIDLDVKPSDNFDVVENEVELHDAMLDAVNAPVKVRKQAHTIASLIAKGELDAADVDSLAAEGVDPAAVAYWKKYLSQVDGGSEFASALTKETKNAKAAEDLAAEKVKLASCFKLAYAMASRGLCSASEEAVSAKVDELMGYNDVALESMKRTVASYNPEVLKTAGKLPQVGLINNEQEAAAKLANADLVSQFSSMLGKSKRVF